MKNLIGFLPLSQEPGNKRHGLMVDELFGRREIVIKSLGDYFTGIRGFEAWQR